MPQRLQAHLDGAQRAQHHRRVDVAHVGDAEGLAGQLAQADAQHHAALVAAVVEQRLRVAPLHQDVGDRVGPLGRVDDVEGQHLAFDPLGHRGPRRFGQQGVAPDRRSPGPRPAACRCALRRREQQVLGRRAAVLLVVHLALAEGPVPVERAQVRRLVRGARPLVGGDEGQTRRRHQALLRARHGDVDAPGVHVERHAAERGHAVDHQQGGMLGRVDRLADGRDVVDDAGGGVDLHDQDGLDGVRPCRASGAPRARPDRPRGASRPSAPRPRRPSSWPSRPSRRRSARSPAPARCRRARARC